MTHDLATEELTKEPGAQPEGRSAGVEPEPAPSGADALAADDDEAIVPDPHAAGSRGVLAGGAGILGLATLVGTLSASGIWEPHELKVADLARRIAVNLMGATGLTVEGGVNTVPTAGELARGELPFTSMALFFRLFGLSEWAGRLPMALYGAMALFSLYWMLARLADRVTAAFAVIVLSTAPLFFLQARTMLGDIVAIAGVSLAMAGLALAAFDTRASAKARIGCALAGVAGMALGFGARGLLVGVAVPALSVGLARLLRRGSVADDRLGTIFGALSLSLGVGAILVGLRALAVTPDQQFSRILGGTLAPKQKGVTFDAVVLQLGHGLLPWSAVAPFAFGRLLAPPPVAQGDDFERESSARVVVLLTTAVAFGVYALLAPSFGVWAFGAVAAIAAAVAFSFRDFERGVFPSRIFILGVAAFLILFYTDYKNFPEKGLAAFAVEDAKFPESFKARATLIIKFGAVAAAALAGLFLFERDHAQRAFVREEYVALRRLVSGRQDGKVALPLVGAEALALVLAAITFLSDRYFHFKFVDGLSAPVRQVARFAFVALPLAAAAPFLVVALRDGCRVVVRRLRVTRAVAALSSLAAFGAVLSFVYYPSLARQISPKEVFESFRRFSRPGEEMGMVGGGSGSARYYAQRDIRTFPASNEAFAWLTEREDVRRWLVIRASDVGQLNSQYRGKRSPAKNLPILDARSSEILLASNQLRAGETNENPFGKWLLEQRPSPTRPLDVDFNGQLHCSGWDITTADGEVVDSVRAGKPYLLHLFLEVTRPITGEWQTFVHIDGYQRRYNGDHDTLGGKYPFHLWKVGDYIVDEHELELEPNFTAGDYTVYFGFYKGDTRLAVKRGPAQENRVTAGALQVR